MSFEKSRLIGKSLDKQEPSRLQGKSLEARRAKEEGEKGLERGTVLINSEMAEKDPASAEFVITDVVEQEGRGVVYFLENEVMNIKLSKRERLIKEEIERGKYRLKE